ncbi:glycosyltransferase family 2 protein [soil metagenome]
MQWISPPHYAEPVVDVVIPARNEEQSIGLVLASVPPLVRTTLVVDNGSSDQTARIASGAGATVVAETRAGYGSACAAGLAHLQALPDADQPDIVVFLDADFSDHAGEMPALIQPLVLGEADLVIGSRVLGQRSGLVEPGALLPQARFGNALACALIHTIWGVRYSDLGPFRAVRFAALSSLGMRDRNYGWTVEMQIRAVEAGLRVTEVPVSYRRRTGKSQISGTLRGSALAGTKILLTIGRHAIHKRA